MSTLSLIVVETESGAEVRVRDSEEPGEAYPSLRAALDSLLTDAEFKPKAGILRTGDEPVGVWRWIDATAEEPAPIEDGSQVTRDVIATMAAGLNSGSPAPMDGGTSTAHSQLEDTSTPSDGFAHVGVEVRDLSGRWHLFLYCELDLAIAASVDSGRLAYGSVGFTSKGRLLQHALTNVPAVEGLRPNNSIRGARGVRVHFRTTRITMPKATNDISKRGPALDLLAKIAASLGVSVEDEMSAESFSSPLMDAISAIKSAAKTENALEAAAGAQAPAAPPAEGASAAARAEPPPVAPPPAGEAPRAEGAFADAAAMELFASESLALFRDIFGKPDEAPAAVLDLAKASSAAFKGAIGQAAPPADAGAMSVPADAARAASDAHQRTLDEVAKLRTDIARRDLRDAIAKRATDAKVALPELDQLVTDALAVTDVSARDRMISSAVRAAQTVPSGDVFGRSAPGGATDATTLVEAAEQLMPEVAKANPGKPAHVLVSIAQRTARARFPHLDVA